MIVLQFFIFVYVLFVNYLIVSLHNAFVQVELERLRLLCERIIKREKLKVYHSLNQLKSVLKINMFMCFWCIFFWMSGLKLSQMQVLQSNCGKSSEAKLRMVVGITYPNPTLHVYWPTMSSKIEFWISRLAIFPDINTTPANVTRLQKADLLLIGRLL